MCDTKVPVPAAPPAPPPILEQAAPKSAASDTATQRKRKGMSRYKINTDQTASTASKQLGGIPRKTGV